MRMKKLVTFIAVFLESAVAIKCFVCTGERDHIGFKDARNRDCWENPENSKDFVARSCSTEEDRCVTSVMVDFRFDGVLVSTMTRKCASPRSVGIIGCKETDDKDEIGFEWKDCKTQCFEDGCNDSSKNEEVLSQYSTGSVQSCRTCSETKTGDYNDLECEEEEAIACPPFADTSCFTAAYTREYDGTYSHQLNKGCSSFKSQFENKPTCYEINSGTDSHLEETCKESCPTNDCNTGISKRPCLHGQSCPQNSTEFETTTEFISLYSTTSGESLAPSTNIVTSTKDFSTDKSSLLTTNPPTSTTFTTAELTTSSLSPTMITTMPSIETVTTTRTTTTTGAKTTTTTITTPTLTTSTKTTTSTSTTSLTTKTTLTTQEITTTSILSETTTTGSSEDPDDGCDHTCIIIIACVVPATCVLIGLGIYLFIFRDKKDTYEAESVGRKTYSTEVKDTQF